MRATMADIAPTQVGSSSRSNRAVGMAREWRNEILRALDVHDYSYVDWPYGPTALTPDQEPPCTRPRTGPLSSGPDRNGHRPAAPANHHLGRSRRAAAGRETGR